MRVVVFLSAALCLFLGLLITPHRSNVVAGLPCGSDAVRGDLTEPPFIDVSTLPVNAQGLHELVLRVARVKDRFCYRYQWNGLTQTTAPTISVHRGERFALRLINDLTAPAPPSADAAVVAPCMPMPMPMAKDKPRTLVGYLNHTFHPHFIPMDDTDVNLHLHGFQGPARQEDVFLSTLSTPAHACEYDVTIPLTQPPGTYFYHPHAHGMADDEVAGGLAGMWIVQPDTTQIPAADEHVLILRYAVPFVSDNPKVPSMKSIEVASALHLASLSDPAPVSYDPFNPPPWPEAYAMRAGKAVLDAHGCGTFDVPLSTLDGMKLPARLSVPAGEPQLLRFLDATSDSFKYLRMREASGVSVPMHIVARDGVPVSSDDAHPLSRYVAMKAVLLPPTGRVDILLALTPGERLTLYSDGACLSPVGDIVKRHDLLTIEAGIPSRERVSVRSTPLSARESRAQALVRYAFAHRTALRRRAITYTEYAIYTGGKPPAHPEFFITDTTNRDFHEHPFAPVYRNGETVPANPDIVVKRGTVEEWYIFNATLETHSFHIHQMAFAAEDEPGGPAMLDTAAIPAGRALRNPQDPNYPLVKPTRTRVLLDFRNVPRGVFLFHCHMLFHEDRGMMAIIRVE
jgi:FtsP/CotA-like multicopper oxidase with cupredoxin domain